MDKLYFITSSKTKLLHVRYLFRKFAVRIEPQQYYGVAYREPRVSDRPQLLAQSFEDAMHRWSKGTAERFNLFFIEDTSVIIHALSNQQTEVPGVDIKFWLQTTNFVALDALLRAKENDRTVTVRSDVLLYLPAWLRKDESRSSPYRIFSGFTRGSIVSQEVQIVSNPLYPWLDARSFNKWFVPNGESLPLSRLPIARANNHDIRRDSIGGLARFLEGQHLVKRKTRHVQSPTYSGALLDWPPVIIVCGRPCAGKTTVGGILSDDYGYYHMEASDFMRLAYSERVETGATISLDEFAAKALRADPGIVARQILAEIGEAKERPIVITGFRAAEEIEIFRSDYRGDLEVKEVFVVAGVLLRYQRCLRRDRLDAPQTISEFKRVDRAQQEMGLARVEKRRRIARIVNEGSLEDYEKALTSKFRLQRVPFDAKKAASRCEGITRLEDRVLLTLAFGECHEPMTTTQIAQQTSLMFRKNIITNKNNVSRYFNQRLRPYYRSIVQGKRRLYMLSSTGRSRAWAIVKDFSARTGAN
jgi:dephospho-CoA kinase/inosine/xanthosine triphosphate pyrophosphatase family protein